MYIIVRKMSFNLKSKDTVMPTVSLLAALEDVVIYTDVPQSNYGYQDGIHCISIMCHCHVKKLYYQPLVWALV